MNKLFNLTLHGIAEKFREMGFPVRKVTVYDDSAEVTVLPSLCFNPMPRFCKGAIQSALHVAELHMDTANIELICLEDDTCETCVLGDNMACLMLSPKSEPPFSDGNYEDFLSSLYDMVIYLVEPGVLDPCREAWELSNSLINKVHELDTDLEYIVELHHNINKEKFREVITDMYIGYLLEDTIENLKYTFANTHMRKLLAIDYIAKLLYDNVTL